jgi:transitional endoplasmic reticulum ATPase
MKVQVGEPKTVALVRHVTSDRTAAYLELRNGQVATCTTSTGFVVDVFPGDVVLINASHDGLEKAPKELWHEEPWVGVVRLLHSGRAIIDVGGRLRIVSAPDNLGLRVGNTVEGSDSIGIVDVLSENPVRYIDLPAVDDATIEQFKSKPGGGLSFEDFGGFPEIVKRAQELVEVPLEHHVALTKIRARPIKGVLFTGESGSGKTLLARIIASQAQATFYVISGPEVLSKWYGQSEELLRKLFEDAARQERAIVVFDEIDSLATQRSDESHEASRRIVGQLLTSMDGFSRDQNANVVVIATTNRPQDIDRALRRPGRFDWEIYFPPPSRADREAILVASARGLAVGADLPHALIAEKAESWSAAELAAIWSEAALLAVTDQREKILEEDYVGGFEQVAARRTHVLSARIGGVMREGQS